MIEGKIVVVENQSAHVAQQKSRGVEIAQTPQPRIFVGGFRVLDQIGQQRLGELGRVVLGVSFQSMEQRRHGRGSTRLLQRRNGGRFSDPRHAREPFQGCRRHAFGERAAS